MDRETVQKNMKTLKQKSAACRKEGKIDMARQLRRGAERLWRKLKASAPRGAALHKKAEG